jgi:hypothetical protein
MPLLSFERPPVAVHNGGLMAVALTKIRREVVNSITEYSGLPSMSRSDRAIKFWGTDCCTAIAVFVIQMQGTHVHPEMDADGLRMVGIL